MSTPKFPLRLEISNSTRSAGRSAWRLISTFDGFYADDRIDVLTCAERMVDALMSTGAPRVQLRVTRGDGARQVLSTFEHDRGWRPLKPRDLLP